MSNPKYTDVEYIESGAFQGGEEDTSIAGIKYGEDCVVMSRETFERVLDTLKAAYARGHYCDKPKCPGCKAGYTLEFLTGRNWTQEECE